MIEAAFYALLCGCVLSALLVPSTALALRRATQIGGGIRHMIWFMVLLAPVGASIGAFAVSVVRPAAGSDPIVTTAVTMPANTHSAAAFLATLWTCVLACWSLVMIARLVGLTRRVAAVRAMKQRAVPVHCGRALPRGARVLTSEAGEPSAVGFLHPAIILPSDAVRTLDPMDVEQIVLHEAAHLRRCDDLTGLISSVCAAVFWFNPFIHHIAKKLSLECEIACDEHVIEQTGDANRYAALLFEMAQNITGERPALAWNGFAHRCGLVVRIQNLLFQRAVPRRSPPWPALIALAGILLSSAGLAAFNAPAVAQALDSTPVRVHATHVVPDVRTLGGTRSDQRVRAFPVCSARNHAVMHTGPKFCEDPGMRSSMPTTRIKQGTATS
jgi:beta-lactamase regulating signal transducer with metallopeptidase domain